MWGSSFADLAKKAAGLQEQATHAVSDSLASSTTGVPSMGGFSTVAGGFFNLDGLQKEEQEQNEKLPEKQKMAIAAIGGDHGASPPPAAAAAVQVVKTPTVIHHHATFPSSIIPSKTTGLVVPSHKTPLKVPSPKKQFPKQTVSELKSPPTTPANVTEPATPPDQQLQSPNQSPATVAPQLLPTKANLLSSSLIQQPTTATEGLSCPSRQPSPPSKISSKDQDSVWQEEQGNDDGVGDIRNKDENIPAEKPKDGDGGDEAEKTNEKEPYLHLPPQPPQKGEIPVCPISEADSVDDNGEGMIPQLVECDSNKDLSTTVALLDSPTNEETRAIESKKQEKETPIAAASIPENVYQQFSNQIQRLEENHEAEKIVLQQQMEAIKRQHLQEVEELQQQQTTWNHKRENYRLQLDSLKRELEGTQQLLEENSKTEKKLQEAHLNQLRGMEKQINHKQDESKGYAGKVQELLKALQDSKSDLKQSKEEYDTLKGRVKVVAGELKERRIECRTLQSEADILKANNSELQDRITHLEGVGMDMNKSTKETEEEVNTLKGKLIDQAKHLELAQAAIEAEKRKGDEALSAYKKKAQQSLAVANARTASAVQAKEEAELEARAARSTADIAMQRAMAAEHNGKETLAEAQGYVSEMKEQVENYNDVKRNFEGARKGLIQAKLDAEAYSKNSEILKCDLLSCQGRLEAEQRTCQDVRDTLCQAETNSNELYEETERLRKEIQRLKDEVGRLHKNRGDEEENPINNTVEDKEKNPRASVIPAEAKHTAEAEATISILQQELQDANQAIKELKETLKSAVEEQAQSEAPTSNGDSSSSIPLFYAMEKQAELMQARNEIARLANLLGNNESSKQDALDAMESMNLNLEETRAKLKRQEESQKRTPEQEKVNLEYLKNIVLSYLNAKTVQEKKALLPVMGTVLCWTPEETRQAMETLEKGGRVVDTVSTSLLGKLGL